MGRTSPEGNKMPDFKVVENLSNLDNKTVT